MKKQSYRMFSISYKALTLLWQLNGRSLTIILFLETISGILPVIGAWSTKILIDEVTKQITLSDIQSIDIILFPMFVLVCIQLLGLLINNLLTYVSTHMTETTTLKIEKIMIEKITSLKDLEYFENPTFYKAIQIAEQGINTAPMQIFHSVTLVVRQIVLLLSFLGLVIYFEPLLVVLLALPLIPRLIIDFKLNKRWFAMRSANVDRERRAEYIARMLTSLDFIKEAIFFDISSFFSNILFNLRSDIAKSKLNQRRTELVSSAIFSFISLSLSIGIYMFVILQAFFQRITIGDITLYTSASSGIQAAFSTLVNVAGSINRTGYVFEEYEKLMAMKSKLESTSISRPIPPLIKGIELKNISFRYTPTSPWVLKNINLIIPKGMCIALVGLNGSGKSTLAKLLMRLYDPTEGCILWDGVDIREFDPTEYRLHLGVIFQDFIQYDLTVKENIGIGKYQTLANDDLKEIEEVAQKIGLHNFIMGLPHQYDSLLTRWLAPEGEGVELSTGQWQRFATARALIRNCELLILDEPTASIDVEAEYEIYKNFTSIVRGRSCILISHRFSTIHLADYIAVLHEGLLMEHGSHDTLISNNALYAQMYNRYSERTQAKV